MRRNQRNEIYDPQQPPQIPLMRQQPNPTQQVRSTQSIENDGFYEERSPLQRSSTRYEVTGCVYSAHTNSAHTVVVDNPDYGRMLFLDGELQSSCSDEAIYHETLVHPIMRALNGTDDKHVLVVGGAEGATVREVLRWGPNKVRRVDWVDIDPELVNVCRTHLRYANENVYENEMVRFHGCDIFEYLNRPDVGPYDVIILDLPDPDPENPYLYGPHFWNRIRRVLREDGGLVTHVGPVEPGVFTGLNFVVNGADMGNGTPYHTFIPSFQGEWGFWMSVNPATMGRFPRDCNVIDDAYHNTIMHWDRHWRIMN